MSKKVNKQELEKAISKLFENARERGLNTCILSDPQLITQRKEKDEAELMQVKVTFAKPTKQKRVVYY